MNETILIVDDGITTVVDKVKGEKRALLSLLSNMKEAILDKENAIVGVIKGDNTASNDKVIGQIEEYIGRKLDYDMYVGPVIACHSGPGVLGVFVVNL